MSKQDTDRLFARIQELADRLTEGDERENGAQLASELRQSGTDPETLCQRFYDAASAIARRERTAGRPTSLALRQAIEQMAPDGIMPADSASAAAKMARWLDKFSGSFVLPSDLEAARAFRKSGDVDKSEEDGLDELEQQLKDDIRKEHEEES